MLEQSQQELAQTCEICGDTIEEGASRCAVCAQLTASCNCCDDFYDPDSHGSWGGMCPDCAAEHFECEGCGEVYHNDDYGGDGLCMDCSPRHDNPLVKPYHTGASCNIVFHSNSLNIPSSLPDNKKPLYFGVELETDYYKDRDGAAEDLAAICQNDSLFWLENDSSLEDGIEIISQPCTLDYHLTMFPWWDIQKIVGKHGGKSHETTTCGLHIHFNRSFFGRLQYLPQVKLIYLFEKFWDELVVFSRRDPHSLEHNAKKYGRPLFDCAARKKVRELHLDFYRYQAVNIRPSATIEIRIFRGTLEVPTILASIELTDFLVRLVATTSTRKLQALTWAKAKEAMSNKGYQYLPAYLIRRDL